MGVDYFLSIGVVAFLWARKRRNAFEEEEQKKPGRNNNSCGRGNRSQAEPTIVVEEAIEARQKRG